MLAPFLAGLVSFIVLDGLWLGLIMSSFYRTALGPIARVGPDGSLAPIWAAALPVYVLLALGEIWFVLPRSTDGSYGSAALWGAAFGLVTYGVYDFTNWSTLRGYSSSLVVVDIAWGMFTSAIAAVVMQFSLNRS